MTPSKYQIAIYDHIEHNSNHALIDAVAGSGKTTTIVQALDKLPMEAHVLFVAFNRHIAEELKKRVPFNVDCSTLNSLGNQTVRKSFGYCKIKETKMEDILWFDVFKAAKDQRNKYYKMKRAILKFCALFKSYGMTAPNLADCEFLQDRYAVLREEENGEFEYAIRTHELGMKKKKVIDFDDQIFFPLAFDLPTEKYDYVFVDEAQDLNPAQMELVKKVCHEDGMIVAVGDTRQAIYGFRGADPEAMENMATALNMTRLPLSICYRCAKNIVVEAQEEVPHIEPFEGAEEGTVAHIDRRELMRCAEPGDYILCRTTAPLVELALSFIRNRQKAYVRGRDFGQNLLALLPHINDLDEYEIKMQNALKRQPAVLMATQDQIDTMRVLLEVCGEDARAIKAMILDIFETEGNGIMLSTIHRSKGLETDRVYLLRPDLVPHPKAELPWMQDQEHNLKYIAITRAKKEFYYVLEETQTNSQQLAADMAKEVILDREDSSPSANEVALTSAFHQDDDVVLDMEAFDEPH